ncbi:MAG: hypothetical protein IJ110_08665, partial [Lachnospiraceae bacterium]|nr:hypothetical protein [Lachnospiraceae bacterium]
MRTNESRLHYFAKISLIAAIVLALVLGLSVPFAMTVKAAGPTDEIEHFIITVDVQEDASLLMTYHIDWKVLDDQAYGPLEWVDIGVPNKNHSDVTALSSNISRIEDKGSTLAIYLDRKYYADEVVSFEYSFVQDHMYQIDRFAEGETAFIYTPAWFDGIEVKDLIIRWNADKAGAWQPDCMQEGGYLVFQAPLSAGERYTITVAYPNDAFAFSPDRQAEGGGSTGSGGYEEDDDDLYAVLGGLAVLIIFFGIPIYAIVRFIRWVAEGLGFGTASAGATEKKIVRTKIEYYETCPSCGAGRVEGKDECPYCGRSMIKSKEIVEEKDLEKPKNYSRAGTYRYGSSPNTYIHVNVINVPVRRS